MVKRFNNGFSLLELLLVVAISVILILSGIFIYRNIQRNIRIDESITLLHVLKQNAHILFRDQGTYGGTNFDMEPALIASGAVPNDYIATSTIRSPYNSDVNVVSDATGLNFIVTFTNAPQADCINVGKVIDDADPDLEMVVINGTDILPENVNVGSVTAECQPGNANIIAWRFN